MILGGLGAPLKRGVVWGGTGIFLFSLSWDRSWGRVVWGGLGWFGVVWGAKGKGKEYKR